MKIKCIDVFREDLPLKIPFEHASSGLIKCLKDVFIKITDTEGNSGLAEIRGNNHYVTGETPDSIVAIVRDFFAPLLLGKEAFNINEFNSILEKSVVGNSSAKALVNIALHDLKAKFHKISVAELLGGIKRKKMPSDAAIAFMSLDDTKKMLEKYLDDGFRFIKIRVGMPSFKDDIDRVREVRKILDKKEVNALLSIDGNQCWEIKEAISKIKELANFGLAFVEQPVPVCSPLEMKFLKDNIPIPLMADESVKGPKEASELIKNQTVDYLHIKLSKAGGFTNSQYIIDMAEAAGIGYMIGSMDIGPLGSAATIHLAASSNAKFFELGGFSKVDLAKVKSIKKPPRIEGGFAYLPSGYGLGIEIDDNYLDHVACIE